ncbi:MAG: prepilin-type N-terminal cleavage/methylation domain-containing protein [Acidobacteriota bacterium]
MGKKGFTLIELLIVVAIIGIVAAIAVPNLLTAVQRSKQKATISDLRTIGVAVGSYMTDNFIAPADLSFGSPAILDFHIKKMPVSDAWGFGWSYQRDSTVRDLYSIGSGGRGGVFSGFSQYGTYINNALEDFENDMIFSVGVFVYGPKVK